MNENQLARIIAEQKRLIGEIKREAHFYFVGTIVVVTLGALTIVLANYIAA